MTSLSEFHQHLWDILQDGIWVWEWRSVALSVSTREHGLRPWRHNGLRLLCLLSNIAFSSLSCLCCWLRGWPMVFLIRMNTNFTGPCDALGWLSLYLQWYHGCLCKLTVTSIRLSFNALLYSHRYSCCSTPVRSPPVRSLAASCPVSTAQKSSVAQKCCFRTSLYCSFALWCPQTSVGDSPKNYLVPIPNASFY